MLGVLLAAIVVPWSLSSLNATSKLIKQHQELVSFVSAAPTPDPEQLELAQAELRERSRERAYAAEQGRRIFASLQQVRIPAPPVIVPRPTPQPAYSIIPSNARGLLPLDGWNEQTDKKVSGTIHINLMWRNEHPRMVKRAASRAPCLKWERRPAQRLQLPYGWLSVPERSIPVSCAS
jgi:hypothetical protein